MFSSPYLLPVHPGPTHRRVQSGITLHPHTPSPWHNIIITSRVHCHLEGHRCCDGEEGEGEEEKEERKRRRRRKWRAPNMYIWRGGEGRVRGGRGRKREKSREMGRV